jgi:stress response protein YsnF
MTERTVTALYDTKSAAESARDDLVALGVPSADVAIRGTEGGGDYSSATSTSAATEDKGFWGGLADLFAPDEDRHAYAEGVRRGGHLLTARVPDGLEDEAIDALERHDPVDLDQRAESWRQEGWTGHQAEAAPAGAGTGATAGAVPSGTAYLAEPGAAEAGAGHAGREERRSDLGAEGLGTATATAATNAAGEEVLQVAEERVRVGKREVGRGGVRVRSYVTERPVEERVELRQERVTVERRPVDRPVEAGDAAFQERTIEAVERGEEAVVDKDVRVTEEIGLRKDVDTRTETVRDTVRKQEVEVEDERAAGGGGSTDEERLTPPPRDRPVG